jgi:hypothetical protein
MIVFQNVINLTNPPHFSATDPITELITVATTPNDRERATWDAFSYGRPYLGSKPLEPIDIGGIA